MDVYGRRSLEVFVKILAPFIFLLATANKVAAGTSSQSLGDQPTKAQLIVKYPLLDAGQRMAGIVPPFIISASVSGPLG